MTTLTARSKNLFDRNLPFECCNCPLASDEQAGKYRCALIGHLASKDDETPTCLGHRVKTRTGRIGEIAVVRIKDGAVYFRLAMEDGGLAEVLSDACTLIPT